MTGNCGGAQHSKVQSYTPKSKNSSNPFADHVSKPGKKMNHSTAAANFYGTPSIKASFKIGKY